MFPHRSRRVRRLSLPGIPRSQIARPMAWTSVPPSAAGMVRRVALPMPAQQGMPMVNLAGLGDLGRFSIRRVVNKVIAPVKKIAAPVTKPLQKFTAPVVKPIEKIVSGVNDKTVRKVAESDAARTAAIRTAVTGAQAGLVVGGSFLGPAGTVGGALAAQMLTSALAPKIGTGWNVGGVSVGQVAGSLMTGGASALIPTALQTGVSLLASRGGGGGSEEIVEALPEYPSDVPADRDFSQIVPQADQSTAATLPEWSETSSPMSVKNMPLRRVAVPMRSTSFMEESNAAVAPQMALPTASPPIKTAALSQGIPWPVILGGAAVLAVLLLRRPSSLGT